MRHPLSILAALCALLAPLTLQPPPAHAQAAATAAAPSQARVIVRFRADAPLLRRQALAATHAERQAERAQALGTRIGRAMKSGAGIDERTQVVFAEGVSSEQLAAGLAKEPDVELAVVDHRRRHFAVPNDPLYAAGAPGTGPASGQWYLKPPSATQVASIDAERAWDITTGSPSVVVAVLDTGVRFDHPDLTGNLVQGVDMIEDAKTANDGDGRDDDASDPGDWVTQAEVSGDPAFRDCVVESSSWHGTQVTGLVGAVTNNATGMASVGRTVRVLPVRVLGKCGGFDSDIVAGMRWAAGLAVPGLAANANPAKVINLSLGGEGTCSGTLYPAAIADVTAQGAVVVSSAGNSSGRAVSVPANCPGVIGVGGLRHVGTKVGFSDLGPEIAISAPAGNCVNLGASDPCVFPILTTSNAGAQAPAGSIYTDDRVPSLGTSFSAPLVAGTAGLMLSVQPALSPTDVRTLLQSTARPFPTTGGDNGDGTPVVECTAPQFDAGGQPVDQAQCFCTTGTCGAGMLDARAAVLAASGEPTAVAGHARIDISPRQPVAGSTVQLTGANSLAPSGRTIVGFQWALVDGGGIVTGISNATSPTASVVPSAPGRFKVRLTVQDSAGALSSSELTMTVNAETAVQPPSPEPPVQVGGGGGGGGALGLPWLLLLAAAIPALAATRARRR